jgi:hypothetical protein
MSSAEPKFQLAQQQEQVVSQVEQIVVIKQPKSHVSGI